MNSDSSPWRRTQYDAQTSTQKLRPRSVDGSELFAMLRHASALAGSFVGHQLGRVSAHQ